MPFDNYDFEDAYKKQCADLSEWEMERLLKEGKVNCLYRTATTKSVNRKSGHTILEAQIYPSFRHPKDVPRTGRKKESCPAQRNLNDKYARRYLIRLANINFGDGDIWATFGWNDDLLPEDTEGAKRDITNFVRRIDARRKKKHRPNIKYIYILAFDGYERPHFHIVMTGDGVDRDELESIWGKCDRPNTRRIKIKDAFLLTGMATYITQNPHGTKRWCSSRNLEKPSPPTKSYRKFTRAAVVRMARNTASLETELQKAYPEYTFRDAEVHYNGITAAFYIYARMTRN